METFEPFEHACGITGQTGEFCQLETFEPECWKNEVIVIEKAIYGRHRVGKCITAEEAAVSQDERFFGCSTDVIGLLDAKCSGRKRCQVRIPDAELERTEPCLSILKMFLEVSYRCVEGKSDNCCHVSKSTILRFTVTHIFLVDIYCSIAKYSITANIASAVTFELIMPSKYCKYMRLFYNYELVKLALLVCFCVFVFVCVFSFITGSY